VATSLRIVFAGAGEFGIPTLRALLASEHQVVQVYSQPDRPAGRGRTVTPTAISQLAIDQNIPLARTADINAEALPPADLLVVIAFGQKISEKVAHHARLGSVNLHASILPRYRGAAPIHWAILRGETITGNSIIRLAQRMDAGAILGQSSLFIGETETAGELHERLSHDGAALMLRVARELGQGTAGETPQDETQATSAPKLSRETSIIQWNESAQNIARKIRGLYPWPGCRVKLIDETGKEAGRLTLVRGIVRPPSGNLPGTITDAGYVMTGSGGAVEVLEVQPEGKRPMSLADFRNGRPWKAGMRLESLA
jgi:methionyl-tRNA formyltransferase